MSRKGNKQIMVDQSVEVRQESNRVVVKGPKGELSIALEDGFEIKFEEGALSVVKKSGSKATSASHGLFQSLLANMVHGVHEGYKIELEMNGVGYRVQKQGNGLSFSLGYSHPVTVQPLEGIEFQVDGQTKVVVQGIDKQKVGQIAADIIKLRDAKRDPYKGKGIMVVGTVIRKKAGKKVK